MLACTKDDLDLIQFLVENGADIEYCNKDGWNALHISVRFVLVNHFIN
jgi:ankyrin repeat protein